MSADRCRACKPGTPCTQHALGLDTATILAALKREATPYNAAGGVGTPWAAGVPGEEHTRTRHGLSGRLAAILHPRREGTE